MPEPSEPSPSTVSTNETTTPEPPRRLTYGTAPEQFVELWLPDAASGEALPVVALIHGGFWRNPYDLNLMDPLAADLVGRGFAVWNIEYRRLGDDGGGWPGTLVDVADAVDALTEGADDVPLDLDRVGVVGHSAGGHLALWAAGRTALSPGTPGASPVVVPTVAIGQGAVVDLVGAAAAPLGNGAVMELLGGTSDDVPDRYAAARPRLDAGPKMVSVFGSADDIVPSQYSVDPDQPGAIDVVEIAGADHFDLINPTHRAWDAVVDRLETSLGRDPN